MDDTQSIAPATLDHSLPDALLRAREAALLALRPALSAHARGLNQFQGLLLHILALAGEPLHMIDVMERGHFSKAEVYKLARQLIALGYAEWTAPIRTGTGRLHRRLALRDIGRRQVNHIVRDAERHISWDTLAARPPEARINDAMRQRLFTLLIKVRRAAMREAVLDGANTPNEAGEDVTFGLPLQLRMTRKMLLDRIRPALRAYQFTEIQWRVLRILAWQPGLGWSVTGLGRRGCFHFSSPSVTRALFYLSQRGLVRKSGEGERPKAWRIKDNKPQKRWRAEISRNGLDIVRMVEREEAKHCADLFERLEARELAELERLLHRLTFAMLWRPGIEAEEQDVHPFAAEYRRFDALTQAGARAFEKHARILKQNGLPVPKRRTTNWYD